MSSIRLKYRASTDRTKAGRLYIQVIHNRAVRHLNTEYRIFEFEWDKYHGGVVKDGLKDLKGFPFCSDRKATLKEISDKVDWEQHKLKQIVDTLQQSGKVYTVDDIIKRYKGSVFDKSTVFEYMQTQSVRMKRLGKVRTGETYQQTLHSFQKFRKGVDLYFDMLDATLVNQYESYMRSNNLSRNTTSFYMRILRCIFNRAVEHGLTKPTNPFKQVYTGVDKTIKRAITLQEIKRIKALELTNKPDLNYARDMFLMSFYLRGISFIDLAYLRKSDLSNSYITYNRKKTGHQLSIRWEHSMQEILDKYPENPTQYLMPIITREDGTQRRQYLNKILFVNRKLKQVAKLAKIPIPLTMYVSRHSWASIAQSKNVPLSIISKGMGHDNEATTRIYLAAIRDGQVDEANHQILNEL